MSYVTFTVLILQLLLLPTSSASNGDGNSSGNVTTLPLTHRSRVINTFGQVCPLEHVTKTVRDEMSQDIRNLLRNSVATVACKTFQVQSSPATSCSQLPTGCPSGNYWISTNGTAVQVYCDMDRMCGCNTTGGWTRIANLNVTDKSQQCPGAWVLRSQNSEPRLCGRGNSGAGCLSATYSTYGMNYSYVCGRVVGYQFASPDGFGQNNNNPLSIDRNYVDGVSLTHGLPGSRQHIWSFVAGVVENLPFHAPTSICPCAGRVAQSLVPSYVGDDYFCESGTFGGWTNILYADDPLWDGQGCGSASCCELSYPSGVTAPWFCKQLTRPTTDDIEVRICGNQATRDEDTPIELVELYIH